MQVVGVFMIVNASFYDVKKYQLKWFIVFDSIERTWVRVLCMQFVCYFTCLLF